MKFKKGDKVELITSVGRSASKGATAKVLSIGRVYINICWYRNALRNGQEDGEYLAKNFKLVKKTSNKLTSKSMKNAITKTKIKIIARQWGKKSLDTLSEELGVTRGKLYHTIKLMRKEGFKLAGSMKGNGDVKTMIKEVKKELYG